MTTTTSTTAPSALPPTARPRTPVLHRAVGWAAVAGTLPYLTLKALWLARVDAGLPDPAMLTDSTMIAMNGITAAMDALVIALALALTHRWGYRLPAWLHAATGVGRHRVPGADRGGEPACHGVPARPWQHSGRRFPGPLGGAAGLRRVRLALLYVLAGGGATMAVLSAGPHLAVGAAGGDAGAVLEAYQKVVLKK